MKVANVINVILQGFGFVVTIIALLLCYSDNKENGYSIGHFEQNASIIVVIAEVVIGGYQLIHAFVISILKLVRKEFGWLMGIYWILGVAYVISWFVLLAASNLMSMGDDVIIFAVLLGWIPIVYYLIFSMIDLKKSFHK